MGHEYEGSIALASKGIFYEEFPEKLTVQAWGSEEERILLSPSLSFRETVDRLVRNCTDCPIPPGKLLLADRQHLFFYMRCLSYGGAYEFPFQCEECGERVDHPMDLEKDLEVVYSDNSELLRTLGVDVLSEPFEFELPIQKKTLGWRMLRGDDESAVDKYSKKKRKKARGRSLGREDYAYRLALRIMTLDGEEITDILDALDIVGTLKGKDLEEFRYQISRVDVGIDPEISASCSNCGFDNEVILKMDKSFFRPPRNSRR